jgi:hypothetical protein
MKSTGCRTRKFHPTIDITSPNLNNSVTLKPGLRIHKDGSRVFLGSQTSKLSISHRFPSTHNNPSTQLSSTQPIPPKRMDLHPSMQRNPLGSASPSFQGLQHSWSRISMMELSGLVVVSRTGNKPTHLRHVGPKSWLDCTNNHYNQLSHG